MKRRALTWARRKAERHMVMAAFSLWLEKNRPDIDMDYDIGDCGEQLKAAFIAGWKARRL